MCPAFERFGSAWFGRLGARKREQISSDPNQSFDRHRFLFRFRFLSSPSFDRDASRFCFSFSFDFTRPYSDRSISVRNARAHAIFNRQTRVIPEELLNRDLPRGIRSVFLVCYTPIGFYSPHIHAQMSGNETWVPVRIDPVDLAESRNLCEKR